MSPYAHKHVAAARTVQITIHVPSTFPECRRPLGRVQAKRLISDPTPIPIVISITKSVTVSQVDHTRYMVSPAGQPLAHPGAKENGKLRTASVTRARHARRNRRPRFAGARSSITSPNPFHVISRSWSPHRNPTRPHLS